MNFHFDGAVAEMYGVDGAVFISRLQFWIEKNAANDRHYHKGRYWTYNSLRAMEKLFPFWSRRQIERIVKNLKDKGVLLTANYARDSHDRTLFYALDESISVKAAGGRSVTVNVTIQGNVIGNREYTEQVGEYVGRKVLAALGNT